MSDALLFVYGTLRRGSGHWMSSVLAESSDFVDEAVFQGRLFLVSSYSGVVPSHDPFDQVIGETYRLHAPGSFLRRLDEYEGCNPRNAQAPYVRHLRPVALAAGRRVTAWIYLYNRPIDALTRIRSGDFLAISGV